MVYVNTRLAVLFCVDRSVYRLAMAAIADDSGKEIKTVQDVLKSDGNDELKFGLLIGLVKVSQVSNKDVVNTVLHLVSLFDCRIHLSNNSALSWCLQIAKAHFLGRFLTCAWGVGRWVRFMVSLCFIFNGEKCRGVNL